MFTIKEVTGSDKIDELNARTKDSWSWLSTPPEFWWIAEDNNKQQAGYAAMRILDKDSVYIGPTFIEPMARGCGLQARLIEVREVFARKMGYTKVLSCTHPTNIYSSNNLIRCGYHLIKPWDGIWPDELYWQKDLK